MLDGDWALCYSSIVLLRFIILFIHYVKQLWWFYLVVVPGDTSSTFAPIVFCPTWPNGKIHRLRNLSTGTFFLRFPGISPRLNHGSMKCSLMRKLTLLRPFLQLSGGSDQFKIYGCAAWFLGLESNRGVSCDRPRPQIEKETMIGRLVWILRHNITREKLG